MKVSAMVSQIKQKLDAAGGLKAVYFVACGGSQAAIYPGKYLLQCEAASFATENFNSDEFLHAMPTLVGQQSIVICCSLKTTEETVRALKAANEKGAITIALTGFPDTDMAKNGQYVFLYSNGENQIYSQSNQSYATMLGFELLHQFEGYPYYEEAIAAYEKLDALIVQAKKDMLPAMRAFAQEYKDDPIFYVIGSGPCYYTAYSMACCHLMEMQTRHCVYLHSGEYFHGPFETTDDTVPIVLLKSTGKTRSLDERVERFIRQYAGRYVIIDAKDTGIEALGEHVAEYFNSLVMFHIERAFVHELSLVCGHDMDSRRYMWKVAY